MEASDDPLISFKEVSWRGDDGTRGNGLQELQTVSCVIHSFIVTVIAGVAVLNLISKGALSG